MSLISAVAGLEPQLPRGVNNLVPDRTGSDLESDSVLSCHYVSLASSK